MTIRKYRICMSSTVIAGYLETFPVPPSFPRCSDFMRPCILLLTHILVVDLLGRLDCRHITIHILSYHQFHPRIEFIRALVNADQFYLDLVSKSCSACSTTNFQEL
jgi:hypothetical protein